MNFLLNALVRHRKIRSRSFLPPLARRLLGYFLSFCGA
jgi:hypothetical protein